MSAIYTGPQCPYCAFPLPADTLRTGKMLCHYCHRDFEATVFEARDRPHAPVHAAAATPDGTATVCANHSGNAAATSCGRCGLFICTLCEMNVGDGSYCPSCFDRQRTAGMLDGVAKRRTDYAMLARVAALLGVTPCFYGLTAPLCVWLAAKGVGQRRSEGASTAGMIFVLVVGIVESLAWAGLIGFIIYTISNTPSS